MSLLWVNGTLVDKLDARVSPFDHGFLYGDGAWEHLRVFGGALFRPAEAFAFLQSAATALDIMLPLSIPQLHEAVEATVRANRRTEGYVRVIVTRGPGTIGPDPRKIEPQVFITAEEYQPFPLELYGHGLHVAVLPVRVDIANTALRYHTLGRPDVVMAKRHALRNGCLEAVMLGHNDAVVGCTEGALLLVRQGVVSPLTAYPPDAVGQAAIGIAAEGGPTAAVAVCVLADLLAADEVVLAGTSCGVIAVIRIDGRDIGSGTEGPVTRRIRERFRAVTRGPDPGAVERDTMMGEGGEP